MGEAGIAREIEGTLHCTTPNTVTSQCTTLHCTLPVRTGMRGSELLALLGRTLGRPLRRNSKDLCVCMCDIICENRLE